MSTKFINNYATTLVNAVSTTDTTFVLGTDLPALTAPDYFLLTLFNKSGATESGWEIVKVTSTGTSGGTTVTVVRAQEGTTAGSFAAGNRVEMRLTAGAMTSVQTQLDAKAPLASPILTGTPTAPTASAGTNTTQLATTAFVVGEKGGRRNYLINGNFDKWDYGTSQITSGYGSDSRWSNFSQGSTKTHSQVVCGDTERALFNATYFSRTVVNSVAGASNYVFKWQPIENVALLSGKQVTLSFWAKADANKNIAIEFWQQPGSGGSPSATVYSIEAQQVPLTTTWQKKVITLTMPSIIGRTLGTDGPQTSSTVLAFWFDAGSDINGDTAGLGQQSGTFDIAQVKLEDGPIATNGWHPYDGEFGGEIEACARYYESGSIRWWGVASAQNDPMPASYFFLTRKRIPPSVSSTLGSDSHNVSSGSGIVDLISTNAVSAYVQSSGSGQCYFTINWTASAEL
jgi:hypothetical protein